MISFYPGPSRVYEEVPKYVKEAYDKGVLSINHRSQAFMDIIKATNEEIKKKLLVPDDYSVFYVSSATECWEIIAESYDISSTQYYNGAFGEKWFEYTKKLKENTFGHHFHFEEELKLETVDKPSKGLICLTQNETSNGTQLSNPCIAAINNKYPDHLIAVDATSSMAGIKLDFNKADIWFASVQKCFGLPAGMAVMICSPRAIESAALNLHYNSLANIAQNMERLQTTHTPNVMGIYLLLKTMQESPSITTTEQVLKDRIEAYLEIISAKKTIKPMVGQSEVRSTTVLVVEGEEKIIGSIKAQAKESGLILGNGYGVWKNTTFRIANFPALKDKEVKLLLSFLKKNIQ
ncbi:MAG TPA: aminotransferase class V-fold PLP-dependent enzyme [Fulvivirga sp.]|nr:aminotransferase class V-fold PLP-dependent enzyme [Fulvivirga sp.]